MVASVYMYVKLHFTPKHEYLPTHHVNIGACAAQLVRKPHAFPVLQEGQVIHQEASLLQRLGFELAILCPTESG